MNNPLNRGEMERHAATSMRDSLRAAASRIDRIMARLLFAEWLAAIVIGFYFSPLTWSGSQHNIHPHLLTALLAGPLVVGLPALLTLLRPSSALTRHVIAVSQMLTSVLLIDVTGGRIETHFHIFGSLAFLAFYRDWRVLLTASVVTALDHLVGGVWWPQSIYGTLAASPWRWAEHTWWVAFEDLFLIVGCRQSLRESWTLAMNEARMAFGAGHDVLTGLANRRLLGERFTAFDEEGSGSRAKKGILFVDLDRFKQVNDTLGHTLGDSLLFKVGERLSRGVRSTDTVARVGGDEFVVLIEGADETTAEKIAENILFGFNQPFEIDGTELLLSASVGISLCPEHGEDLAILQEKADKAMYEAKAQGRNRCVLFAPAVLKRAEMARTLKRDICHAMRRHELEVHFQPQVDPDGELLGFEALVRWAHPSLGMVLPSDFIPIAEETGLIVAMGEWILHKSCETCQSWQRESNRGLRVAVNVSAAQFEQDDYADRVARVLALTGLDPSFLTIEITETILLHNIPLVFRQLDRIRDMGVEIALDDFGTGYSSLTYLREIKADRIKLDPAFVHRGVARDATLLESVITMAHRNGLKVTGEGIETTEQGSMLGQLGVDILQGYYYSPPLAPDQVMRFVASYAASRSVSEQLEFLKHPPVGKSLNWNALWDPIAQTLLKESAYEIK